MNVEQEFGECLGCEEYRPLTDGFCSDCLHRIKSNMEHDFELIFGKSDEPIPDK